MDKLTPFHARDLPGATAHAAAVQRLQARVRGALRRGQFRAAVRLTEELRQVVKGRQAQRKALRAMQLRLFPR